MPCTNRALFEALDGKTAAIFLHLFCELAQLEAIGMRLLTVRRRRKRKWNLDWGSQSWEAGMVPSLAQEPCLRERFSSGLVVYHSVLVISAVVRRQSQLRASSFSHRGEREERRRREVLLMWNKCFSILELGWRTQACQRTISHVTCEESWRSSNSCCFWLAEHFNPHPLFSPN